MYTINKITSNHVVDFAAEELKKIHSRKEH